MPPEAEPQEKLNALPESQRLSTRTAAKPRHADGVGCSSPRNEICGICGYRVKEQLCLRASLPAASVHFAWSTLP